MGSRIRASAAKVKTGCVTCKKRHVKCDETKPICRRCKKAGRQCAGYAQPAPRDVYANHISAITVYVPDIQDLANRSYSFFEDDREAHAFEYFRRRTAPCFFSDFSSIILPRMVHTEQAIRHAVIALGSLHQVFERGRGEEAGAGSEVQFALQHYGKAMARLRDFPTFSRVHKTEALLVNCIIFTCIEIIRGHGKSAIRNSIAGLKLFGEWSNGPAASSVTNSELRKAIRSMYVRLQNQLMEITDDCILPMPLEECGVAQSSDLAAYFRLTSAEEFFTAFDELVNRSHYCCIVKNNSRSQMPDPANLLFPFNEDPDVFTEIDRVADHVKSFSMALNRFIARNERSASSKAQGSDVDNPPPPDNMLRLLQIWGIVLWIHMSVQTSSLEGRWDAYRDDFDKATCLAENLFYSQDPTSSKPSFRKGCLVPINGNHPTGKPTFSFYMGLITPLWVITTRCREPIIRRRALHLLSVCHRREGLWHSDVTAALAKKLVQRDEAQLDARGSDIWDSRLEPQAKLDDPGIEYPPEEQRWTKVKVSLLDEGHIRAQMW